MITAPGGPEVFAIQELPDPIPGPEEVLVDVRACGVNHLDLWTEAGGLPVPVAVKVAVCPAMTVTLAGCVVITGGPLTVRVAAPLIAVPSALLTTTS